MPAATLPISPAFPLKQTGDKLFAGEIELTRDAVNDHAQRLDDLESNPAAGTVKTVDGITPGPNGDVVLPASEVYPSAAKQAQVVGLFTSGTQTTAADVALSGDPRTDYLFAEFYDFLYGYWYKCLPNPHQPDANGNATAWWVRR